MSRRDNTRLRCGRCRMIGALCVCSLLPSPRLATRTRLILLIHRFEDRKPTNTGRLAVECLSNSEVMVRGHASEPPPTFVCDAGSTPLLLFPHPDATPLDERSPWLGSKRPVTLIVPDGNWRQASKVRNRVGGLRGVPCVALPAGEPSVYRLRAEAHLAGLSTLEAIARAMGLLEGAAVRQALEAVFRAMVERTLWSRGTVPTAEVSGGIPERAQHARRIAGSSSRERGARESSRVLEVE
jgi:DTW domain-containing protein YfiP